MDLQESSGENVKTSSKDLLYSEKFHESPFLLKKKNVTSPPRIFKVSESSVLKNVQMFLPRMKAANTELEEKLKALSPSAVDIEHTEDTEGPLIEMDLALIPQDISSEESENNSDSSSSSSDSELEEIETDIKNDIKLPKLSKGNGKSKIQVLNTDSASDTT